MSSARVSTTTAAAAPCRAPASTAPPAVTPIGDHPGRDGRRHVPGRVADVPAACRLDAELFARRGAAGPARVWRARRGWRRRSSVPWRDPGPRPTCATWSLRLEVAMAQGRPRALDGLDELAHAGQWARGAVAFLVQLARALVDGLGPLVVDGRAGQCGDLAREPLAVEADQRPQPIARRREAGFLERREPRGDPRLDRVDERAVEIEQDGVGAAVARSRSDGHPPTVAGSAALTTRRRFASGPNRNADHIPRPHTATPTIPMTSDGETRSASGPGHEGRHQAGRAHDRGQDPEDPAANLRRHRFDEGRLRRDRGHGVGRPGTGRDPDHDRQHRDTDTRPARRPASRPGPATRSAARTR